MAERQFYMPKYEDIAAFMRWGVTADGLIIHLAKTALAKNWVDVTYKSGVNLFWREREQEEFVGPEEKEWGFRRSLQWLDGAEEGWRALTVRWPAIKTVGDDGRLHWTDQKEAPALARSLALLCRWFRYRHLDHPPQLITASERPQLLVVESMGTRSARGECGPDGMLTPAACRLLLQRPPEEEEPFNVRLRQVMLAAYQQMTPGGSQEARWYDEHCIGVHSSNLPSMQLDAYKDAGSLDCGDLYYHEGEGCPFRAHNIDNLLHQFILLAGLAALHDYLWERLTLTE